MLALKPGLSLYLASASPRRRELLATLGIPFAIIRNNAVEPPPMGETAAQYARKLAQIKGRSASPPHAGSIILSADTVVCVNGQILGKPKDGADALRMLELLNGRQHEVVTAIYVRGPENGENTLAQTTQVWLRKWPVPLLAAYAACGEPLDKAGAYAIQGTGAFLIDRIEGSWTNVVGLPLSLLATYMLERGLAFPAP